jgi:CheY-like chemotaxis protein
MPLHVMIVDDSPAMRWFVKRVIALAGFKGTVFLEAADGCEAIDLLRSHSVDVVFADVNMPRMNGEEFLRRIAGDKELYRVPVIVISADASEARQRQLLALGARRCLSKPISPEEFRRELDEVLDAARIC